MRVLDLLRERRLSTQFFWIFSIVVISSGFILNCVFFIASGGSSTNSYYSMTFLGINFSGEGGWYGLQIIIETIIYAVSGLFVFEKVKHRLFSSLLFMLVPINLASIGHLLYQTFDSFPFTLITGLIEIGFPLVVIVSNILLYLASKKSKKADILLIFLLVSLSVDAYTNGFPATSETEVLN